jgi:hypothetical protein
MSVIKTIEKLCDTNDSDYIKYIPIQEMAKGH